MRHITHFKDGPDKILHIETEGCKINIIIGTHDQTNTPFTTVEIHPSEPDDNGDNWMAIGTENVLVVPALSMELEDWPYRDAYERFADAENH